MYILYNNKPPEWLEARNVESMFPQKSLPIVQRKIIEQCPIDIDDKFKQSLVEMVMPF
jgi:hypothetical protein